MEYTPEMENALKKLLLKSRKLANARNRLKRHFSGEKVNLTDVDKKIISEFEDKKKKSKSKN